MKSTTRAVPILVTLLLAPLSPCIAGSISTATENGETVVRWNGREVYRDAVEGAVRSKASDVDGRELAAAVTETGEVLWESEKGAAAALRLREPKDAPRADGRGIKVETSDGQTTVTFNGKRVWRGKTRGKVSGRAKEIDGTVYAAAFDDDRLLWENVRGAAREVGAPGARR